MQNVFPGLGVALGLAALALLLAQHAPLIGAPTLAIVAGMLLRQCLGEPKMLRLRLEVGLHVAGKYVLQGAVVLLGFSLSLSSIASIGWRALPVMLGTLIVGLGGGYLIGKWLGIVGDVRTLISVGTSICGASAISTTSAVLRSARGAVAYSIAVIFVFNVLAAVTYPHVGTALGLSQESFGILAGTAINDTSSVVAAAGSYGPVALQYAVVVKLARTLAIIPVCLVLVALAGRKAGNAQKQQRPRVLTFLPTFLVLFIVAAAVKSLGLVPPAAQPHLSSLEALATATAMVAIGASVSLTEIRKAGYKPLLLGALLSACVLAASLGLQAATGLL